MPMQAAPGQLGYPAGTQNGIQLQQYQVAQGIAPGQPAPNQPAVPADPGVFNNTQAGTPGAANTQQQIVPLQPAPQQQLQAAPQAGMQPGFAPQMQMSPQGMAPQSMAPQMAARSTDRLNQCPLTLDQLFQFSRFLKESRRTSRHRLNRLLQDQSTRRLPRLNRLRVFRHWCTSTGHTWQDLHASDSDDRLGQAPANRHARC